MFSQNASTASTSPSSTSGGSICRVTNSMYSSARSANSGGSAWAPRNVVLTSTAPLAPSAPRNAQAARLGVDVQTVARLDLDRGHAIAQQRVEARPGRGQQFLLGRGARRPHRGVDAAARAGDVGVGRAFEALLELGRAVAGPHQVRMAIDEARRQPRALAVPGRRRAMPRGQVAFRAEPGDAPVLDEHCAVALLERRARREARQVHAADQQAVAGLHTHAPTRRLGPPPLRSSLTCRCPARAAPSARSATASGPRHVPWRCRGRRPG